MSSTQESRNLWVDFRQTILIAIVIVATICVAGFALSGKLVAEKTVTAFIQPVGAIWLLLASWSVQLIWTKRSGQAALPGFLWIVLTLCSTPPLVNACNRYLEFESLKRRGERIFDPATDEPLDVLIVLGGGVGEGQGRAQVSHAGDRAVYAAELYHQGKTRALITTGDASPTLGNRPVRTQSELTTEIWTKLGIPPSSISALSGMNTYGEMQSIKKIASSELVGKRVGLLTSALHLPRAIRLARAQQLDELIPVAADYRLSPNPPSFYSYLPSAGTMTRFSYCFHEYLAYMVGR